MVVNSEIRTSAASRGNALPLAAKLLRELARQRRFDSYDALKAALRRRCRQLGITVTCADIDDAINVVESNTRLVYVPLGRPITRAAEQPRPIRPGDASAVLTRIQERTGLPCTPRGMA